MGDLTPKTSQESPVVLTLTLLSADEPRQWKFASGETIQIGRASENDVQLDDRHVSRCHAAIVEEGRCWKCISLGRPGTYFDGAPLAESVLVDGMILEFGRNGTKLRCELTPTTEESEADDDEPVTVWIKQLASGEEAAAGRLWDHYFQRVVRLARIRLSPNWRRVADEEDVAISVFSSLCAGISTGKYPELLVRDNLWRLLAVMTARKAIDVVHHERRQKRGGGQVRGESALLSPDGEESANGFDRLEGHEPSPEFALLMAEEAERRLDDETLREIARYKLDGDTNEEIGQRLGCTGRTVQRRLQRIREIWSKDVV